jgi:site-specific DNA-methyltransferase (adenine-specific)
MLELNHVYNMDCMEGMAQFPDGYFDLAIDDPPYGSNILRKNRFQRFRTNDSGYRNKSIPKPEYFKEVNRVAKASIIWGCQYMIEYLNPDGSFIVWDKKIDPDLHNMSAVDIAWYSKRERIRKFTGHWCGAVKFESEPTIHIHQKPVGLYKWLLKHYARPGFKILDNYAGSFSSVIACMDMGFDYVAFEIDSVHYKRGCKRMEQHKAKLKLF